MKFHENPVRGRRVPYECADLIKLIVAFRNFANASDKTARKPGMVVGFCVDASTAAFFMMCWYQILSLRYRHAIKANRT